MLFTCICLNLYPSKGHVHLYLCEPLLIQRACLFQEWAKNWLYSRQGADAVAEPGLNWMLTLWAYRDAEVRTCDPTVLALVDLKLE